MRKASFVGWLIFCCGDVYAQSPIARTSFDVATVRPVPPQQYQANRITGGPGSKDPEQLTLTGFSLKSLILKAYGITESQLSGPAWINSNVYDIAAKVPPATTKEQLNMMLQSLLTERFRLTLHHEERAVPVYFLIVDKNGPKLTKAAEPVEQADLSRKVPDKDGYYDLRPGVPNFVGISTPGGGVRVSARAQTMTELARNLGIQLDRPVIDKTELGLKYDFRLGFSTQGLRMARLPDTAPKEAADPEPDLFQALQQQLGLKLESGKELLEFLVIDSADKTPSLD
jgi:uncharacterized protein (TIGR03435 family)